MPVWNFSEVLEGAIGDSFNYPQTTYSITDPSDSELWRDIFDAGFAGAIDLLAVKIAVNFSAGFTGWKVQYMEVGGTSWIDLITGSATGSVVAGGSVAPASTHMPVYVRIIGTGTGVCEFLIGDIYYIRAWAVGSI